MSQVLPHGGIPFHSKPKDIFLDKREQKRFYICSIFDIQYSDKH